MQKKWMVGYVLLACACAQNSKKNSQALQGSALPEQMAQSNENNDRYNELAQNMKQAFGLYLTETAKSGGGTSPLSLRSLVQ